MYMYTYMYIYKERESGVTERSSKYVPDHLGLFGFEYSDPSAFSGKICLVKRASKNAKSAKMVNFGYEMCPQLANRKYRRGDGSGIHYPSLLLSGEDLSNPYRIANSRSTLVI